MCKKGLKVGVVLFPDNDFSISKTSSKSKAYPKKITRIERRSFSLCSPTTYESRLIVVV